MSQALDYKTTLFSAVLASTLADKSDTLHDRVLLPLFELSRA